MFLLRVDHPSFTSQNAVGGPLSGHSPPSYSQQAGLGGPLGARGLSNQHALSAAPGHSQLSALPHLCPAPEQFPEARKNTMLMTELGAYWGSLTREVGWAFVPRTGSSPFPLSQA